jgi:filamentous hemagglutinin
MSQIIIDVGSAPDDGTGDPIRDAFIAVNNNFTQIFSAGPVTSNIRIANNTITTTVINGNIVLAPSGIGVVQTNTTVMPRIDNVYDLGTPTARFNTLYLGTGGFESVGNITGNYFIGNGSLLTDVISAPGPSIIFGNTTVSIPVRDGPVLTSLLGNVVINTNTANTTFFTPILAPTVTANVVTAVEFVGNITGRIVAPGNNTEVLFNQNGNVGAASGLNYYTSNNSIRVTGDVRASNLTVSNTVSTSTLFVSSNANVSGSMFVNQSLDVVGNAYVFGNLEVFQDSIFNNDLDVTGNLQIGNITSQGAATVGSLAVQSNVAIQGNLQAGTTAVASLIATGNILAANLSTTGNITATGNISAFGVLSSGNTNAFNVNVTNNAIVSGTLIASNAEITSAKVGNILPSANVTYDIGSPSLRFRDIYLSGNTLDLNSATIESNATAMILTNPAGGKFVVDGTGVSDNSLIQRGTSNVSIPVSNGAVLISSGGTLRANISNVGLTVTGNITASQNMSAAAAAITGNITAGNANISGNTTVNNLVITGNIVNTNTSVIGNLTVTGLITGGNINTAGSIQSVTANIGNATVGNLIVGNITGNLRVTQDAVVDGNLTVNGNVTYVNVQDLNIEDPIIGIGRGANDTPLIVNDGKDRGEQLWYYSGSEKSAFIGYDNSGGNLIAAVDASITNEIVTVNNFGNFVAGNVLGGNIISAGLISAAGNIETTANIGVGNIRFTDNTVYTGDTVVTAPSTGTLNNFQWQFSDNAVGNSTTTLQWNLLDTDLSQWYLTTNNQTKIYTFDSDAQAVGFSANGVSSGTLTFGNTANGGAGGSNDIELTTVTGNAYVRTGSNSWRFGSTGNLIAPGNVTATAFLGRGLFNGNSSIEIPTANGNIFVGVGGIGSIEFTAEGINALTLRSLGNVSGATANITGNVVGGNINTAGQITATGNVTGGNINATSNVTGAGAVFSGNVTAANFIGNIQGNVDAGGSNTEIQFNDNDLLAGSAAFTFDKSSNLVTVSGNVSAANLVTTGRVDATGNVTGGNITTAGSVDATGNITGANVNATANVVGGNIVTAGRVDATGNVTGGNLTTAGLITATGNITGGNLTTAGLITATGNVTGGNIVTAGRVDATGNVSGGNIVTAGRVDATGNVSGGNIVTAGQVDATGNVSGSNLVTTGNVTAAGNVAGGNITTAGRVDATGNIAGGNITTAGRVDATGNVSGGNITTLGQVTATGNVNAANVTATGATFAGNVTSAANISAANIIASSNVAATGNVSASYFIGNGALLSGIDTTLISNGTSNVKIVSANGNATINIAGTSNVAVFANTGANITGILTVSGNITGSNLSTSGSGGNITGANVVSANTFAAAANVDAANISSTGNISATGNVIAGNLTTAGRVDAIGNVTGGNIVTAGLVSATGNVTGGNLTTAGAVAATGNVSGGNINASANVTGTGAVFSGNVTAANFIGNIQGNVDAGGADTQIQFNDNDILNGSAAFTFNKSTNAVIATGNVTAANLVTGGVVSATGNVTGGNLVTGGKLDATGNVTGGNLGTAGTVVATGNVDGGNVNSVSAVTAGTTVAATGNVSGGNITTAGQVDATGNVSGGNLVTAGRIDATGNVAGGNITTAGRVDATGNVSGGNLVTAGQTTATGNVTGGNLVTAGRLVATGNVIGNIFQSTNTTLQAPTVGDYDGERLRLYDFANAGKTNYAIGVETSAIWMGVDTNLEGQGFKWYGNTTQVARLSGVGNLVLAGNLIANSNVTGANITTAGVVSATGNVTGGNITTAGRVAATGNVSGGNLVTTGNVDATGVVTAANLVATTSVVTDSISGTDLTIVTSGNIQFSATGNLIDMGGSPVINVGYPSGSSYAATKQYVDDSVSSGITIHQPVQLLACTFCVGNNYAQGGTTATVTDTVAGNTVVFSSAIDPQVNDQLWFTNSFNGVVGNVPYFVVSAPNTSAAVLSTTYGGDPVANITTGGSLTEPVRINSGQGATITNAGANIRLVVDSTPVTTGDRVILTAQTDPATNGVYDVTEQGAPDSPGPGAVWVLTRSSDMDTYRPDDINGFDSGDYFYVQNGVVNKGESWVMTAPVGPFIIGYDAVTLTQFSASQVYSGNAQAGIDLTGTVFAAKVDGITTSFDAGGNIKVKDSADLVTPNIGNATGNSLTLVGNGLLSSTAVSATGNITGGNLVSQADVTTVTVTASGNVTGNNVIAANDISAITVTATANVSAGNVTTTGIVAATGNVDGGNITTSGRVDATGNVTGGNLVTAGRVDATGNVAGGNITTAGRVDATGNVTGGNLVTAGLVSATANVTGGNITTAGRVDATGNVAGGNITTAGQVDATGNVAGGNVITTGNVDGANLNATAGIAAGTTITAIGNVTGGNLNTAGNATAAFFIGDGSQLSNLTIAAGSSIENGNSNVKVDVNGNVSVGTYGTVATEFANTGVYVTGVVSATGNVSGGNLVSAATIYGNPDIILGNIANAAATKTRMVTDTTFSYIQTGNGTSGSTGNIVFSPYLSATQKVVIDTDSGNLTALGNITGGNLVTAGAVAATGNVSGGNITTGGNIDSANVNATGILIATGNVTGGNITTAGNIDGANVNATGILIATGNVTGGNITTAGNIDGANVSASGVIVATANVSGGNITTAGNIDGANVNATGIVIATGNVTGGNITTAGNIDGANVNATGNVTGGNITTAGNIDGANVNTTGNVTGGNITTSGNVSGGNITTTGSLSSADANITGNIDVSNVNVSNEVIAIGNVSANYFLGNGACLTGVITSVANINNGNSNVEIAVADGNVTVAVDGTAEVAVFATTGLYVDGVIEATGNITGNGITASSAVILGNLEAEYANITTSAGLDISGGNLRINEVTGLGGELIAQGNISGLNVNTGNLDLTGNVLSNLSVDGNIAGGNIGLTGNIEMTGGYILLNELTGLGGELVAQGNISGLNVNTGNVNLTGNVLSNLWVDGNIAGGNIGLTGNIEMTGGYLLLNELTGLGGELIAQGNVSGLNVNTGNVNLTGNVLSNLWVDGNIAGGNVSLTGNLEAAYANINTTAGMDVTGGNLRINEVTGVGGELIAQGNVSGLNVNTGNVNLTGNVLSNLWVDGNIAGTNAAFTGHIEAASANITGAAGLEVNGGNIDIVDVMAVGGNINGVGATFSSNVTANYFLGNGACLTGVITSVANINNGNSNVEIAMPDGNVAVTVDGTANVAVFANTGVSVTGLISATGNVSGDNIQGNALDITNDAVINGNLTVNGNVTYVNVEQLNIEDPIIGLGRGANNDPLTTDDGKDRGEQLWYYDSAEKSAFIGYDNSANKLIAALDVTITNEVVSVSNYGNFVAGNLEADTVVAAGNVTGNYFIGNGSQLTGISTTTAYSIINLQGNVAGDANGNAVLEAANSVGNLQIIAGNGIVMSGNATTGNITISVIGSINDGTLWGSGGDAGLVTDAVTVILDNGLITDAATSEYDLGGLSASGGATVTVSATPPPGVVGDMWIDSDDGTLYLYFNDGDGAQWAEMASVYSINQVVDLANVSSNIIPAANVTYDLGNATNRWNDIWLANSTIHIGEATISAVGADLVLPATVQIGDAVLDASSGNLSLPENVEIIGTISAGNISTDNYTFANGAPFSSFSSSDVTTLLASFGSNSISTTGNVGAGFFVSSRNVTANTELGNTNYMAAGPITIDNGVTVTISSGGIWSVV